MALSDTDVRQLFAGNASTTTFAIPFVYYAESEVVVILQASDGTETVQVVGASNNYTLTGGDANNLPTNVEMNTAPATGEKLLVIRDTPNTQALDIISNGNLDAAALEKALDKIVAQVQDVEEKVARAIKFKKTSDEVDQALPEAEANKFPIWNSDGTALVNITDVPTGLVEINAHIADTSTHGVTGDVVGTTDTQTLTNKTLTSPTINTPTITGLTVDNPDIESGSTWEEISTPATPGAGDSKLYPKSDGKFYTLDSAASEETLATETYVDAAVAEETMFFSDVKAASTPGGTFTSGDWRTRVLNTTSGTITGASLGSNQVTLAVGTYRIHAKAPHFITQASQLRWFNTTDTAVTLTGMTDDDNGNAGGVSFLDGEFTIAGTKVFELQHRCQTTRATDGLGSDNSWDINVYAFIEITKLVV